MQACRCVVQLELSFFRDSWSFRVSIDAIATLDADLICNTMAASNSSNKSSSGLVPMSHYLQLALTSRTQAGPYTPGFEGLPEPNYVGDDVGS